VDNSPRYPQRVLEETSEYVIRTTQWGTTLRNWTHAGGVPEFLHHTIVDPESWLAAKERMTPNMDRIPWDWLKANYGRWREEGYWIRAFLWFGFDVTHSWVVGTERTLVALIEQPEWAVDMFNHFLDVNLALLDAVWDAGYHFDEATWCDDMGYKGTQFFSLRTYRELLKPVHKRAIDWAHAKGIKTRLHSCGNINRFVPELIEIGLDMLNPLEVKAGMNPVPLKQQYGDKLAFNGGLNAVLYTEPERLWAEMQQVIPAMKKDGGYIISSDHSVPDSVSLETFRCFVDLAKRLGSYE
jgi:uroporphyrinogen decarboxylase